MSTLIEEIARALAEANKLVETFKAMPPGPFKERSLKRAQKLKGDILQALFREAQQSKDSKPY
jgi:hypothetical protein